MNPIFRGNDNAAVAGAACHWNAERFGINCIVPLCLP